MIFIKYLLIFINFVLIFFILTFMIQKRCIFAMNLIRNKIS